MKKYAYDLECIKDDVVDQQKQMNTFKVINIDHEKHQKKVDRRIQEHQDQVDKNQSDLEADLAKARARLVRLEAEMESTVRKVTFQDEQRKAILDTV